MPTKYKYKGAPAKAVKSTFYLFFFLVFFYLFLIKKLIFHFVIMGYCVLNFEVKINLE